MFVLQSDLMLKVADILTFLQSQCFWLYPMTSGWWFTISRLSLKIVRALKLFSCKNFRNLVYSIPLEVFLHQKVSLMRIEKSPDIQGCRSKVAHRKRQREMKYSRRALAFFRSVIAVTFNNFSVAMSSHDFVSMLSKFTILEDFSATLSFPGSIFLLVQAFNLVRLRMLMRGLANFAFFSTESHREKFFRSFRYYWSPTSTTGTTRLFCWS